jgi:hypothetical protein
MTAKLAAGEGSGEGGGTYVIYTTSHTEGW